MTVPIDGESWLLELRLNKDLVPGGHTLQYQEGGKTVQNTPKKEELDLCHYSGSVRGKPRSWVAVSTCHGVRGVIFDEHRMRYIEPTKSAEIQSPHYLYDHKHLITEPSQKLSGYTRRPRIRHSGHVSSKTIHDPELTSWHQEKNIQKNWTNRYKRATDNTQVREPFNANNSSRYVELVLVADHREFRANGRNVWDVHSQLTQMANIIYSMYAPINIYIALVGVVVWSERDQIRIDENGDQMLVS